MKCHYINDKIAGRVLIPGCMGTAVHNDKNYCTCRVSHKGIEERVSKLGQQNNGKAIAEELTNKCDLHIVSRAFYCQREIEGKSKCTNQCVHCKEYYKPLEQ